MSSTGLADHILRQPERSRDSTSSAACPSFDELFIRYNGPIYGYILRMVGNAEQASDLTQDTFVKAYTAMPKTRELILPGWLYRIASNTAIDALRHRHRLLWLPFRSEDTDQLLAPGPDLPTHIAEQEALYFSLKKLTPLQRACLLLRARDGLSIDEIARTLHISSGNVKMTLHRAKRCFRATYTESGTLVVT